MLTNEEAKRLKNSIDESKVNYEASVDSADSTEVMAISAPILTPTSFDNAKKNLQSFAQKTASDFGLSQVPSSGGLFGWFNHTVTGDELNKVMSQVQGYLSKINDVNTDLIREFGQVYTALESLDKEYIPAILSAVKGAEIASNQAKSAADHAKVAQEDIRKTVKEQKKIIKVLEDHKAKLDKLKHLENVDEIWNASKKLEQETSVFKKNFAEAQNQLSNLEKSIKSLQSFCNQILDQEHLEEIDEIWERVGSTEDKISELTVNYEDLQAGINSCNKTIDGILLYVNQLKEYEHLEEIDSIWNDVQNARDNISQINDWQRKVDEKITTQTHNIADQKDFRNRLEKQAHLFEIDNLWKEKDLLQQKTGTIELKVKTVETNLDVRVKNCEEFEKKLREQTHIFEIDDIYSNGVNTAESTQNLENEVHRLNEEIANLSNEIEVERENQQNQVALLKQKIKVAYITAGTAWGLGLLDLVLNLLGVL